MRTRTVLKMFVTLMVVMLPSAVYAQWYASPSIGGQFGGRANESLVAGGDAATQPWSLGLSAGWARGWLGLEADATYAPRFFDNGGGFVSNTSLATVMGNVRVAFPWGTRGLVPYATVGAGLVRPSISEPGGLAEAKNAMLGWNGGGGVVAPLTGRVGLQADVRYFRAMSDDDPNAFGIAFDGFDYWRTSAGLVFRW